MIDYEAWNIYQQLTRQDMPTDTTMQSHCYLINALLKLILTELDKQQQSTPNSQNIADFDKMAQALLDRIVDLDNRVKNLEQSSNLFSVC